MEIYIEPVDVRSEPMGIYKEHSMDIYKESVAIFKHSFKTFEKLVGIHNAPVDIKKNIGICTKLVKTIERIHKEPFEIYENNCGEPSQV